MEDIKMGFSTSDKNFAKIIANSNFNNVIANKKLTAFSGQYKG